MLLHTSRTDALFQIGDAAQCVCRKDRIDARLIQRDILARRFDEIDVERHRCGRPGGDPRHLRRWIETQHLPHPGHVVEGQIQAGSDADLEDDTAGFRNDLPALVHGRPHAAGVVHDRRQYVLVIEIQNRAAPD